MTTDPSKPSNFIHQIITDDLQSNKHGGRVYTRFPPEPNGYLHIGHAKSICLNFGIVQEFKDKSPLGATDGVRCHLRLDDTNPTKEDQEYIDAIHRDVRWLGFDWGVHELYASDYFGLLYDWTCALIRAGKAYVCDLTGDQVREYRGTPTTPGKDSPFRNRPPEESLDLFARMKKGEFPDGSRTVRAKIDMASPNFNLRDPVLYRILHAHHPRTGHEWCIYPMYDWSHGQNDWMEGITHSICTLEFEDHRPLYEWCINTLKSIGIDPRNDKFAASKSQTSGGAKYDVPPRQIEFARLNITYTVMSKRKLLQLVQEKRVNGWDDPRMPTISGMRRRGYTPAAIRAFCEGIGVAKRDNTIELQRLEFHIREDLNKTALRRMAVLNPLKLVITNYPEGQVEPMPAVNNPEDPAAGSREVPFTRELYIEREDFQETPVKGFFRLSPGKEVRLRYAYWVKAESVVKDAAGNITEVHCTYDPATRGGDNPPDGRKVKATLHWVSATHHLPGQIRLYDVLFNKQNPEEVAPGTSGGSSGGWLDNMNPHSLVVVPDAKLEPALGDARPGDRYQFERIGYFCCDPDTSPGRKLVFNRTVTLKDSWAKEQAKG